MKRRSFLLGALAAPVLIKTGGLELTNTKLIRPKPPLVVEIGGSSVIYTFNNGVEWVEMKDANHIVLKELFGDTNE